jgi:hypothetical protein
VEALADSDMPKFIAQSLRRQGDPSSRRRYRDLLAFGSAPLRGSDQLVAAQATGFMIDKRSACLTHA